MNRAGLREEEIDWVGMEVWMKSIVVPEIVPIIDEFCQKNPHGLVALLGDGDHGGERKLIAYKPKGENKRQTVLAHIANADIVVNPLVDSELSAYENLLSQIMVGNYKGMEINPPRRLAKVRVDPKHTQAKYVVAHLSGKTFQWPRFSNK